MKVEKTLPKRYGFAVIWFMFPIAVLKVTFHTNLREKNETRVYICMYVCMHACMYSWYLMMKWNGIVVVIASFKCE